MTTTSNLNDLSCWPVTYIEIIRGRWRFRLSPPSGAPLLGLKGSGPPLGLKLLGGLETGNDGPITKALTTVTHSMPTSSDMISQAKTTKRRTKVLWRRSIWGFLSRAILPKNQLRRSFVWMLTCKSLGYNSLSLLSHLFFSSLRVSHSELQVISKLVGGKHTAVKLPLQLELVMSIVNLSKWEIPFLLSSKCCCDIIWAWWDAEDIILNPENFISLF